MGWYQSGDPGFFSWVEKNIGKLYTSASRAVAQRYTGSKEGIFSAAPGTYVSGLGGVLKVVGSLIPGAGPYLGGAGAFMEQAGDSMSYAGQGITEPVPDVGDYRVPPYQNLPNFTVPSGGYAEDYGDEEDY